MLRNFKPSGATQAIKHHALAQVVVAMMASVKLALMRILLKVLRYIWNAKSVTLYLECYTECLIIYCGWQGACWALRKLDLISTKTMKEEQHLFYSEVCAFNTVTTRAIDELNGCAVHDETHSVKIALMRIHLKVLRYIWNANKRFIIYRGWKRACWALRKLDLISTKTMKKQQRLFYSDVCAFNAVITRAIDD